jgi:hypothetical protein
MGPSENMHYSGLMYAPPYDFAYLLHCVYSASLIANPTPTASSSRTQPIHTQQNLTNHSAQSETIPSDDDTLIALIAFEQASC